jgi:hypothetical protein
MQALENRRDEKPSSVVYQYLVLVRDEVGWHARIFRSARYTFDTARFGTPNSRYRKPLNLSPMMMHASMMHARMHDCKDLNSSSFPTTTLSVASFAFFLTKPF